MMVAGWWLKPALSKYVRRGLWNFATWKISKLIQISVHRVFKMHPVAAITWHTSLTLPKTKIRWTKKGTTTLSYYGPIQHCNLVYFQFPQTYPLLGQKGAGMTFVCTRMPACMHSPVHMCACLCGSILIQHRGSLKRSARAVHAQCNYLGVWPY